MVVQSFDSIGSSESKTKHMNYSFFLFSKLFDVYHTTNQPYDILFEEISKMYKDWLIWDVDNGKNIGEYESMQNYLSSTIPSIN